MDTKCMEMAALGRPLYPGMLYDTRSEMSIPGVTLWDKKILLKELIVHDQTKTDLKFAASDTVSDKANLLNVSAELKASFQGGVVEVDGSAKYLNDSKTSTNQCRITLQYSQTTKFEQVTMGALGEVIYPQVFNQKTATHVITAALYGAQAFMVFDYTSSEDKSKQKIEGNLHAMVKKIPSFSIEGKASLQMNEKEKELASNISVTFYGDYELNQNPTTFMEALEIYKKLPTLLKTKGVPMKVWLYPLNLLNDKAAKLMRGISLILLSNIGDLLEELAEVERRCNDLFKILNNFPGLQNKLQMFKNFQSLYKTTFQKRLSTVLLDIRSGTKDDTALADILTNHNKSPFVAVNLNKWLENITTEINVLRSITKGLNEVQIVTSSELNSILFDLDIDVVVCLVFTSLNNSDPYLDELKDFLNSNMFGSSGPKNTKVYSIQTTEPLLTSTDISKSLRQNVLLFKNFQKVNNDEKKMCFTIASVSDPNNPGASIRLYQKGILTDLKFQPVSKPPLPEVEITDEGVNLKLQVSPTGKTVRFRVEYRTTQPTDSEADDEEWKVTDTPDAQSTFQLTGLPLSPKYWVRYRAVSDVGVSEASDFVPFCLQGKTSVISVDKLSNWTSASILSYVRTKIMSIHSISRWSLSSIQAEMTNVVNNPSIPYVGDIPGGLKLGMALYLQGTVLPDARGSDQRVKILFFTSSMLAVCLLASSQKRLQTAKSQFRGSAFDIFFAIKTEGYEVYVNGQRYCLFKHRMPVENVTEFNIEGDVLMNTFGIVPNWSTSTFGKELSPGVSRDKNSNIQEHVAKPVCNPSRSYDQPLTEELRPGHSLYFQGVVSSGFESFKIDLKSGSDIALHLLCRLDKVTSKTYRNGAWEDGESAQISPFVKGGAFDIIITVTSDCYEVFVNGLLICKHNHRIAVNKVTSLVVSGDVFMNTFGIIDVESMNMKVKIPADI